MFTRSFLFSECIALTNINIFRFHRNIHEFTVRKDLIEFYEREFDLPTYKVKSMMLHWPSLQKIQEDQIASALHSLNNAGISKSEIMKHPTLLNIHANTINNRTTVLKECGFTDINISILSRYISLFRRYTVAELKQQGLLPMSIDIWERLIECFDVWPGVQNELINADKNNNRTLFEIRMKMLQNALSIKYDLTTENFEKIIQTYPTLRHRSLKSTCHSLYVAETVLKYPKEKILKLGPSLLIDPEQIMKLLTEVKKIGGIDIKEVLYKHSSLLKCKPSSILAIQKIFEEENIPDEAQRRYLEVFTLPPSTIRERLDEIKSHPSLKVLMNNPRILGLVYYKNKVFKRLEHLQKLNKKCTSLHKLISHEDEFVRFASSFGDKTRGVDVIRKLNEYIPDSNINYNIKEKLIKHPFWTHIPLQEIISTIDFLATKFSIDEIFQNCELILYPFEVVKNDLQLIEDIENCKPTSIDNILCSKIDFENVSNVQRLSLLMYVLEKNHNFSGNGVWPSQYTDVKLDLE